jgi:hypothetical protein
MHLLQISGTHHSADWGSLGQQKTTLGGTLFIILYIHVIGDEDTIALLRRSHACQWSQDNTVVELQCAKL